ncbi:MAG: UbiA family prenyltransferase [Rhizobiales bacterium]|nr:UbiA family prenyltransferase [Hyphomicrobiales bacterium]
MSQPDVREFHSIPAVDRGGTPVSIDQTALVVDLDGTLLRTDMLYESYFASIRDGAQHHRSVLRALSRGKASFKAYLADVAALDCNLLPINDNVLEFVRAAKAKGQPVFLATASNRKLAEQVAARLEIFDDVFASDEATNLSGDAKAKHLIDTFGDRGFDYIGNSSADLPVWAHARRAYIAGNPAPLIRRAKQRGIDVRPMAEAEYSARSWLKALRVHQYAKNALIFVPLLTSHAYSISSCLAAFQAFISFSLCASSVYLLNDLIDLRADRQHPTKRLRPFANGALPLQHGIIAIPLLLAISYACALLTSLLFTAVLTAYLVLTLAYSFTLKRRLMVDIVVLSALYSIRVIAGSAATYVVPSEWLLAFSMFVFVCLALVKRYVELALRIDKELPDPSNRNYRLMDLPIIGALAAASGFNAVTIFSLYISSPAVTDLYRHPGMLWLICPILMYWLSRIVILAHRRVVDDDPIVFALRDRNSRICAAAMVVIVLLAT